MAATTLHHLSQIGPPVLSEHELAMLREVDTPTVCNVIDLFDIRPRDAAYSGPALKCCFTGRKAMVGYAVTSTVRTADAAPVGHAEFGTLFIRQLDMCSQAKPAIVVFQDLDQTPTGAIFGEGMATSYRAFGAVGAVTNGLARDLEPVRALGDFACFTTGRVVSKAYTHLVHLDVPVDICGLTIAPGDLLHGDSDGLTVIPAAIAGRVARACHRLIELEQTLFAHARTPGVTLDSFAQARKVYAAAVAKLRTEI